MISAGHCTIEAESTQTCSSLRTSNVLCSLLMPLSVVCRRQKNFFRWWLCVFFGLFFYYFIVFSFIVFKFPPFSTNETGRVGGFNRRELGHGEADQSPVILTRPSNVLWRCLNSRRTALLGSCSHYWRLLHSSFRQISRESPAARHPFRFPLHTQINSTGPQFKWWAGRCTISKSNYNCKPPAPSPLPPHTSYQI